VRSGLRMVLDQQKLVLSTRSELVGYALERA
jgi:hypothetical protein